MTKHDEFGDRMKEYESAFTSQTVSNDKWMCVRIDGKGFSKYTKDFKKPFDDSLTSTFVATTKALVKETHASVGYTQSDEITLLYNPTEGERIFGGKTSKINSVFASIATAHFNAKIDMHVIVNNHAYFDCRVWEVPSDVEASNVLLWRAQDAKKNSVSSLFRWTVGAKRMEGLNQAEMKAVLSRDYYTDWDLLPNRWKYGMYVKPVAIESYLTAEQLSYIPEDKRPSDLKVIRTDIQEIDIGYFGDLTLEQRIGFVK